MDSASEKGPMSNTVRGALPISGVVAPEMLGLLRLGRTRLVASVGLCRLAATSGELRPLVLPS
jgi:hypothetical protein